MELPRALLETAKQLKIVSKHGVGVDNIDPVSYTHLHSGQGGQVKALLPEPAPHQGHPVIQLVQKGGERGQVLIGVKKAGGAHRMFV